jgi:peptidoglycan glycosyltransferase
VTDRTAERHRRLIRRALPALGGACVLAFIVGAMIGSGVGSEEEGTARDFAQAWEQADYAAMHKLLTAGARARWTKRDLERAYRAAAATATAKAVETGSPERAAAGSARLPVSIKTHVFGTIRGELVLPVENGAIAWAPHLVFPGLGPGARLTRRSRPPVRGKLVTRDGKTLAEGPADGRRSPIGPLASSVAGRLEAQETGRERTALYARGFPRTWPVGQTGLERVFERALAGRPGGRLLAGTALLARSKPRAAPALGTTIDSRLQEAVVAALAGRFGGIAAMDARTGEVRGLAGVAFSAPQPPGSTFKLITTTAALEARLVKPSTRFPVQTRAVIDGVDLENANGESCGGSFRSSFAHSCNSVFAPLGVKTGAKRLVAAAERYGFNAAPSVRGELPSTIPPAGEIRSRLELGATAIGQGRVLATPLMLASVAQTVAAGGVRSEPTLREGEAPVRTRVTSRRVARTLGRLMVGVVAYGTGKAAALPGVKVAGKTGTAELEDTRGPNADEKKRRSDPSNTDAWFTAYAPAGRPRIAVAVLLVRSGAGGETAAPAARLVLQTALK